ncbi:MAG: hypothetical protein AB1755_04260, partial [Candidatus Omnitrophota bacterium]
ASGGKSQSEKLEELTNQRTDELKNAFSSIINTNNLNGLISKEPVTKEQIFAAYLDSVKQGEYHLSKTNYNEELKANIRRSYVSGGATFVAAVPFAPGSTAVGMSAQQNNVGVQLTPPPQIPRPRVGSTGEEEPVNTAINNAYTRLQEETITLREAAECIVNALLEAARNDEPEYLANIATAVGILEAAGHSYDYLVAVLKKHIEGIDHSTLFIEVREAIFTEAERLIKDWSYLNNYIFSRILDNLNQQQKLLLFLNMLKGLYGINKPSTPRSFGLMHFPSSWEQIMSPLVRSLRSGDITTISSLYYLLKDDAISEENKVHIWEALYGLADKYPAEVFDGMTQTGYSNPDLAVIMLCGAGDAEGEISRVVAIYLRSDKVKNEAKRPLAQAILDRAEHNLTNKATVNDNIIPTVLEIVEQTTEFEGMGLRKNARAIYINQILAINDIFQEAYNLLNNNPDVSYVECVAQLLVEGKAGERFARLTKLQKVRIKYALIKLFNHRLLQIRHFETAKKEYPIEEFNQASLELMRLYRQLEEAKGQGDQMAIAAAQGNIHRTREVLFGLREQLKPYFQEVLKTSVVPEVGSVRLGLLSLQVEADFKSLQKMQKMRRPAKDESMEQPDDIIDDFFRREILRKQKEAGFDLNMLRDVIMSFPEYLLGNFQDEMIAYLTNAELRSCDIENLIEGYRKGYEEDLLGLLKTLPGLDFGKLNIEEEVRGLIKEMWQSSKWRQIKARLIAAKELIDELVDAKATLIFNDIQGDSLEADKQKLKNQAYREASRYVLGLLQLVPISRVGRLRDILSVMQREIEANGLELLNLGVGKRTYQEGISDGFKRGDAQFSKIGGGRRVFDHEEQHLIFELFTGQEIRARLFFRADFMPKLQDVVDRIREQVRQAQVVETAAKPCKIGDLIAGLYTRETVQDGTHKRQILRLDREKLAEILPSLNASLSQEMGRPINLTLEQAIKFIDGHETLHALIDNLRLQGIDLSKIFSDERSFDTAQDQSKDNPQSDLLIEERLANIFGLAFALRYTEIPKDLEDELEKLDNILKGQLKQSLTAFLTTDASTLEERLAACGLADVNVVSDKTSEQLADIKDEFDVKKEEGEAVEAKAVEIISQDIARLMEEWLNQKIGLLTMYGGIPDGRLDRIYRLILAVELNDKRILMEDEPLEDPVREFTRAKLCDFRLSNLQRLMEESGQGEGGWLYKIWLDSRRYFTLFS